MQSLDTSSSSITQVLENENFDAHAARAKIVREKARLDSLSTRLQSIPHREEAERFLALLDPEANGFAFQTFDDSGERRNELVRIFNGTLDEYWTKLCGLNVEGAGIYVTVNRTDGKGRTAKNIVEIRALFTDLDGAPIEPVMRSKPTPHFVVESSPGKYHAYWRVEDVTLEQFSDLQKALAARFNSDPNVHDLPRVLRLPGFFHRKGEPFLTHIISTHDAPAYAIADFDFPVKSNGKSNGSSENIFQKVGRQRAWKSKGNGSDLPTIEEIRAAIAVIPNPPELSRDKWVNVGQSIHAATDGSEEGFEAFDEWSQKWDGGYDADETRRVWDSLKPHSISAGTLFHLANEADPHWRHQTGSADKVEDEAKEPRPPCSRADVHNVFRKWLGNEYDLHIADAVCATGAAERLTGDPLWLLVISGPGAAKTETVQSLSGTGAHITSTIASEGALLSGTARKERRKDATGGLLRKIGDRGILVIKDVTSILSSDRNIRASVLAA